MELEVILSSPYFIADTVTQSAQVIRSRSHLDYCTVRAKTQSLFSYPASPAPYDSFVKSENRNIF